MAKVHKSCGPSGWLHALRTGARVQAPDRLLQLLQEHNAAPGHAVGMQTHANWVIGNVQNQINLIMLTAVCQWEGMDPYQYLISMSAEQFVPCLHSNRHQWQTGSQMSSVLLEQILEVGPGWNTGNTSQ